MLNGIYPLFAQKLPFTIPFHTSVYPNGHNKRSLSKPHKSWNKSLYLYKKYAQNNVDYQETPRIPKIIHQIWLGSPLPAKDKIFQKTWLAQHPDWQYKLWTDQEVQKIKLANQKLYDRVKNLGEKSDILRYELLLKFGGLYVDTDFECLQSFDIFHHCFDFYSGSGFGSNLIVFNGLIGSKPGHPLLHRCIAQINKNVHQSGTSGIIIQRETGPYFFTACFRDTPLKYLEYCVIFPASYFYPWPYAEKKNNSREQIEKWIKPETYALHHWHGSWVPKRKIK